MSGKGNHDPHFKPLNDAMLRILYYITDGEGHPLNEIASGLGYDKGHCSRMITELRKKDMVFSVDRVKTRSPKHTEHPLYINKNYYVLRIILSGVRRRITYHTAKVKKERPRNINKPSRARTTLKELERFQSWLESQTSDVAEGKRRRDWAEVETWLHPHVMQIIENESSTR